MRPPLTATRKIRSEPQAYHQPYIVALTASAFTEDQRACLDAGMDGFLYKPLEISRLRAVLHTARRRQVLHDQAGSGNG